MDYADPCRELDTLEVVGATEMACSVFVISTIISYAMHVQNI